MMDTKQNELNELESSVKHYQIETQRLEQQISDMRGQMLEQKLEVDSTQVGVNTLDLLFTVHVGNY